MFSSNALFAVLFVWSCSAYRAIGLRAKLIASQRANRTHVQGLIGTSALSKAGLPAAVVQMRKMLDPAKKIALEDDAKCGAQITERKQKLRQTLVAMHNLHVQNAAAASKPTTAVVVGGGPVGLVAAMEAWQGGATVHVLEQRNGYTRLQNVEVETPHHADQLMQDFFEAANALAEIYEMMYDDPPKASKDLVKITDKDMKSIRIRLDLMMSAPVKDRMCYYLKSSRHTCVIKTVETLVAASLAELAEMQKGSLHLHYFAQYITTCGVPHKSGMDSHPRAVYREVATRDQRRAAVPEIPCAEDLPHIADVGLLVDATGGRGNVRAQFIARELGGSCHSHWQVRVAEEANYNGVTVPLLDPEVYEIAEELGIDHGEEDAISIVSKRIEGVVCPRFSNSGLDFTFPLPVFDQDGVYVGKGDTAVFSDYFWQGLPRFSENACQYVPLLRVPRENNPIAQLLLLKGKASGSTKQAMEAHLIEFAQAFMGSMHGVSPTNKKFKATDGGAYPIYEFGPMSVTLFKTSLRVPPHGDSIRGYPSDAEPVIVFAETGDQESPAYYRTGSGISAGADRASRLVGVVQKLGASAFGVADVKQWQVDTLKFSLKKYCLAMNYLLTNTMFPNRFFGIKKAAWTQSKDYKVCGALQCSLGNIFETECAAAVDKPGEIEKLIDPSTTSSSEVLNWFAFEGHGDECAEAHFTRELQRLEAHGAGEYYSTELTV